MSLTLTTPLLVEQTGVAVILPFHLSIINHPSISPFTTQQCVHQDLQEETFCLVSVWYSQTVCLCLTEFNLNFTAFEYKRKGTFFGGSSPKPKHPKTSNISKTSIPSFQNL